MKYNTENEKMIQKGASLDRYIIKFTNIRDQKECHYRPQRHYKANRLKTNLNRFKHHNVNWRNSLKEINYQFSFKKNMSIPISLF